MFRQVNVDSRACLITRYVFFRIIGAFYCYLFCLEDQFGSLEELFNRQRRAMASLLVKELYYFLFICSALVGRIYLFYNIALYHKQYKIVVNSNQSNQIASEGSNMPTPSDGTEVNIFYPMTLSVTHLCKISYSSSILYNDLDLSSPLFILFLTSHNNSVNLFLWTTIIRKS